MVHLPPEELLAILKTARARSARDWAMILLAYRHGLRASEVCDLKMADVDLKAGSLSIRRLKGSLHTVQPLYRHKGQPLLDEIAALRGWLRERQPDGSDYAFLSQKGGRLHRSQFFRVVQACAEAAGLGSQKRHPRAEALPGLAPRRWQREPRTGPAVPRTQGHRQHDEVRRGVGLAGYRGCPGRADAAVLECNRKNVLLHFWPAVPLFFNHLAHKSGSLDQHVMLHF